MNLKKPKKANVVQYYFNEMGADPEMFFTQKLKSGFKVIESEKFLPKEPIEVDEDCYRGETFQSRRSTIKRDGVQLEFSTTPNQCRAYMADDFQALFQQLKDEIADYKDITVQALPLVKLKKKDMKEMSQDCLKLGCNPSLNAYSKVTDVTVKGEQYQYRGGGGHIHFAFDKVHLRSKKKQKEFAKVCDILVGNTCVLVDKDKGLAERRKVYGKAGEYRLPSHGFEYRTLSNFWLNNYKLMHLVFGLSRMAYSTFVSSYTNKDADFVEELFALVDEKDIQKAINENDYDLALKNFEKIEQWLNFNFRGTQKGMPFCTRLGTAPFKKFIKKPYTKWFGKNDLLKHWADEPFNGHEKGWEAFEQHELGKSIKEEDLLEIKVPKGVLAIKDAKVGTKVVCHYPLYNGKIKKLKGAISRMTEGSNYVYIDGVDSQGQPNKFTVTKMHGALIYNNYYMEIQK